jgi:exoribonuclease-2
VEEAGAWEGSLADLADLLGSAADPSLLAACWLWLHGDQTLFRVRQAKITPRRREELRPLRQERRQQALRKLRREEWLHRLQARQPLDASELTAEQQHDLNQLHGWAGGATEQPLSGELQRLLRECHCPLEPGPIRHLLVDLGQWERHHLPSLEATTWQHGFTQQLLEEADQLVAQAHLPFPGDGDRVDRCEQRVVTIDDDDTLDIDDGLALETTAEGRQRLWIHIADPGRLVAAGTPLDLEARRRGTSLYLARGNLPMFPPQLAHGPMSLRCGERSAAWSLWVELDSSGAVLADGFERSWIRPTYRLSYSDVDELIELAPPQEADLLAIHDLLKVRHRWRIAQGALNFEDPEGRIRCRGERAELEVVEASASRRLVAEAMVLAGSLVAERGLHEGLALPFRSQPSAELPTSAELDQLPCGPVRHAAIKRCLSRGLVGTSPAPHFSLGLRAYVQATSPIRRYGDLLVQRQLLALRAGEPPMAEQDLTAVLTELEGPLRQGLQIGREDQRHWLQVWFEQQEQRQWPGLFLRWLRQDHQLALVWLDDLAQSLPCICPPRSEPGSALVVRVSAVDSLQDLLRLEATA